MASAASWRTAVTPSSEPAAPSAEGAEAPAEEEAECDPTEEEQLQLAPPSVPLADLRTAVTQPQLDSVEFRAQCAPFEFRPL